MSIKTMKIKPSTQMTYAGAEVLYLVVKPTDIMKEKFHKKQSETIARNRANGKIHSKPVKRISSAGQIVYFKSVSEAAQSINRSQAAVSLCLTKKTNMCAGYRFEYVNENKGNK